MIEGPEAPVFQLYEYGPPLLPLAKAVNVAGSPGR